MPDRGEPAGPGPASGPRSLDELRPGQLADVIGIDPTTDAALAARLRDLGVHPSVQVRAVRRAPLGSPVVYRFDEVDLCLRRREASRIRIGGIR
jgi:ferrous iron transport protein A